MKWYWKDGTIAVDAEIGTPEWEAQMRALDRKMGDPAYKRVALDNVKGFRISTVWLALDHAWIADNKPEIFETMVFNEDGEEQYMERYSTEALSLEGHKKAVEKYDS